jgi:REP element-mobilizing transposase RayT
MKHKLYHTVPNWVQPGAIYHIRVRCESENPCRLTEKHVATPLLRSVAFYHIQKTWYSPLFLLMPDHIHALISFPPDKRMSNIIGQWKSYNNRKHGILWQENYFDHRLRNDTALDEKADYIRKNPVAKGYCKSPQDWPWVFDSRDPNEWL